MSSSEFSQIRLQLRMKNIGIQFRTLQDPDPAQNLKRIRIQLINIQRSGFSSKFYTDPDPTQNFIQSQIQRQIPHIPGFNSRLKTAQNFTMIQIQLKILLKSGSINVLYTDRQASGFKPCIDSGPDTQKTWYLYEMVAQNMLRTYNEKQFFSKKNSDQTLLM